MLGVLILLIFAWWTSQNHKPIPNAVACAATMYVVQAVLNLGGGLVGLLPIALATLVYCLGYFWLLERFTDTTLLWFVIFAGGAVLWFGGMLYI